jgi:phage terminase large subunit
MTPQEREAKERELLQLLELELAERKKLAFNPTLFDHQRAFMQDTRKLKAALCSRRAGKSHMAGCYVIAEALKHPTCTVPYVALTRGHAKRIMWRTLLDLTRPYSPQVNLTELRITLPNGSDIVLAGANDEATAEVFRGQKFPLVVLDECASFRSHFKEMVEEVIEPALIDYNGTLAMIGTPSAACRGLFFDATTNKDSPYSVHRWTILDNPFIPHAKTWLAERMKERGWTEDTPAYRREWLGEWVASTDSQVYAFSKERNMATTLPTKMDYILGIDLGYDDETAFVVVGYRPDDPRVYVVETYAKSEMIISDIIRKIEELTERYKSFARIVADTGGLGKQIAAELRKRYGVPVFPAEKTQKAEFIQLVNDDFRSGRVLVHPQEINFIEEISALQWDEEKEGRFIEDPRFANHRCDAFLYAWRESNHYLQKTPDKAPEPFSDSWYKQEEDRMLKEIQRQFEDDKKREEFLL